MVSETAIHKQSGRQCGIAQDEHELYLSFFLLIFLNWGIVVLECELQNQLDWSLSSTSVI